MQSKRLNMHLKTAQGEKPHQGSWMLCLFACYQRSPNWPPAPQSPQQRKGCNVVLPQTCRHAAAARVRDACGMQVFLLLGKATRAPEGGGKPPCRLGEQDVARLGRPVRAGWRG
jgi:hypothetical protein